jgi:O-succinylbenzoate synthase
MPELGIGSVQTLHLSTLPNFAFPTDVQASGRWFVDDIVDPLITVQDGMISIPSGAGNGHAIAEKVIERYKQAEHVINV